MTRAMLDTPLARRTLLGIVYCPTCEQDTIPWNPTGKCGWCDTQLVKPWLFPNENSQVGNRTACEECDKEFVAKQAAQRFCCKACQQRAWTRTPRGRVWDAEHERRKRERARYVRGLGRVA